MSKTVKINKGGLAAALAVLLSGGVITYPTETLYGLGTLAINKEGVKKIFAIKARPGEKTLPLIVGSFQQARTYFKMSKKENELANKFWPGPLSLVLKTKSPKLRNALGADRLAVRYSANKFASLLAESSGAPLVSTSANLSGRSGCFTIAAVKKQFARNKIKPDLYVDGGTLEASLPSTIVAVHGRKITVIRNGKIVLPLTDDNND
ncbi:L-threonylcarbamoyladenylate synthase [Patescibacteria group bacterium]|nr:L-threonylcarbamoyladenylate synthase [Patescibacteria group bacterium]